MANSRTYHSLHLDISTCQSDRICYIILPERLKEQELPWLDSMADTHNTNFVVISGVNWEEDLTPWKAPGLKTHRRQYIRCLWICFAQPGSGQCHSGMALWHWGAWGSIGNWGRSGWCSGSADSSGKSQMPGCSIYQNPAWQEPRHSAQASQQAKVPGSRHETQG